MGRTPPIPLARLQEALAYDPASGILSWRDGRGAAGRIDASNGYIRLKLDGIGLYAHNVIWFMMTGEYPSKKEVDHIDLDRANNRWINFRRANPALQQANRGMQSNNRIGLNGVSYCASTGRYRADIRVGGKRINLGRRDTPEEAAALYADAAKQHFGEFARTA